MLLNSAIAFRLGGLLEGIWGDSTGFTRVVPPLPIPKWEREPWRKGWKKNQDERRNLKGAAASLSLSLSPFFPIS